MKKEIANQSSPQPEAALDFYELAELQGIQPITDFDVLLGNPSPEDESREEFAATLREWRREGSR